MSFTVRRNKIPLGGEHATLREAIAVALADYASARTALVIEQGESAAAKVLPTGSLLVKQAFIAQAVSP